MLPGMNAADGPLSTAKIRPLRRVEYDRLVDLGVFDGEPIELIQGRLVIVSPQGEPHAFCVTRLNKILVRALGDAAEVRPQQPLAASDVSEPEPDIAVVPAGDYLDAHPRTAHLVIEVSVSSLREDRQVKGPIYAAAGVTEYWIVDVGGQCIEVYSDPGTEGYAGVIRHGLHAVLTVPGFPDVTVRVRDVMPPSPAPTG